MNAFNNMNEENQYRVTIKHMCEKVNYKIFKFINEVLLKKAHFYNKNKDGFAFCYIGYYIDMLNNNMLLRTQNLIDDYQNKIWENFAIQFNTLYIDNQDYLIDSIIFEGKIFRDV